VHHSRYDAAEENEISFHEGEKIVEIEAVSDDWWQGKTADGRMGLFPGTFFSSSCWVYSLTFWWT
jgi:hypothetical protein